VSHFPVSKIEDLKVNNRNVKLQALKPHQSTQHHVSTKGNEHLDSAPTLPGKMLVISPSQLKVPSTIELWLLHISYLLKAFASRSRDALAVKPIFRVIMDDDDEVRWRSRLSGGRCTDLSGSASL
jgi:hypothetical protein